MIKVIAFALHQITQHIRDGLSLLPFGTFCYRKTSYMLVPLYAIGYGSCYRKISAMDKLQRYGLLNEKMVTPAYSGQISSPLLPSSLSSPHPIHPAPQNLFPRLSLVDSLSCSI